MGYKFYPVDRDQMFLLPPSLKDWLPEKHIAWMIIDIVNEMDLTPYLKRYRDDGSGHVAYHPAMMTGLLLYSYCMGERSSRQIERLCEVDVAYRVISGNRQPDHATIARFRQNHSEALENIFMKMLELCNEAGLVKLGVVALDGTKMKANASLAANRTYEGLEKEVKKMLAEASAKDEEEDRLYGKDRRGDELPEDLADPKSRLARLRECKARLEQEAEESAQIQRAKIEERMKEEERSGKKRRGRKPKDPPKGPDNGSKANVTDPESRIMKTASGFVQGFNAQAVVTENQIILAAEVTQEENDKRQLHPMIEKAQENIVSVGIKDKINVALADTGYASEGNLRDVKPDYPELIIAMQKDCKQRNAESSDQAPRGRIPSSLTATEKMERKLKTKRGKALYKKRSQTIEPVFGQIKGSQGCDGFTRRGKKACASEWKFICAVHNMLKLWRHMCAIAEDTMNSVLKHKDLATVPG
jgi:transposase